MFTTYLVIYSLLAVLGVVEIATGFLQPMLGMGVHVFLSLFTIIFVIHAVILMKNRTGHTDTQAKLTYNSHHLSLVLVTFLALLAWLLSS